MDFHWRKTGDRDRWALAMIDIGAHWIACELLPNKSAEGTSSGSNPFTAKYTGSTFEPKKQ